MEDDQTRKRPRSTSPVPPGAKATKSEFNRGAELAAQLKFPRTRNDALNELMKATATDMSYSLDGEDVLRALVDIFFESLGWSSEKPALSKSKPDFSASQAWTSHVTPEADEWATFCSANLAKGKLGIVTLKLLESVLLIMRNLSFVAANHRLMAYSPDVITVLTGALYETTTNNVGTSDDAAVNNNSSAIATHAMHALVNIAQYLDVTGQKLLCDKLFLVDKSSDDAPLIPDGSTFGQAANGKFGFGSIWLAKRMDTKEDFVSDISNDMVLEFTGPYLLSVWAIFPAITKVLLDSSSPRLLTMMAVDFLQEFLAHTRVGSLGQVDDQGKLVADARSILINIPTDILHRLVELLFVPRLTSDSLEYVDPTICVVTRVNTLRMLLGYDATVDTDVRDRSLDVLVPLVELDSPAMTERLAIGKNKRMQNRLYDSLLPILTTQAGRTEAPTLALQLLKELSKGKMNRLASVYIRERLIALGSQEPKIAHLALNYFVQTDEKG